MTEIRLRYLHSFRDRHGHVRFYFRYRGNRWPLPAPHEEGFASAYDAKLAEIKTNSLPAPKNLAYLKGSLGWVIERFLASSSYEGRAETTKRNYRRVLDVLKQRYGAGLIKDLQSRHVKAIRNEIRDASTTTAADIAISLISTLWDFADEELNLNLGADPTYGIRRVHVGHREHEPWPQEVIERFIAEAPAVPRLGDTIIVGERGRPLTAASLSVMVRKALRSMGVSGYSIHGLRKNAGNALAEADGTEREIMVRLGHKSPQMAAHYTKRASQKKLARSAVEKLERAKAVR